MAVEQMAESAEVSARVYVVERPGRRAELLYGVSVFAHRQDRDRLAILERFATAPMFVEAPVHVIRASGFEVIPTGENPDHFDVQLMADVNEGDATPSENEVRGTARRLLDAAGDLRPNPAYSGGTGNPSEEE
jgi:hypothetical protein